MSTLPQAMLIITSNAEDTCMDMSGSHMEVYLVVNEAFKKKRYILYALHKCTTVLFDMFKVYSVLYNIMHLINQIDLYACSIKIKLSHCYLT